MTKTDETLPSNPGGMASAGLPELGDRYSIIKEIGRGGMGRVFAARDRKLGREVAIKLLAPGAQDEKDLRRFEQEALAAGSLDHPNILAVHDIGTYDNISYIVSELLHGATLRAHLRKPLSVRAALAYAVQLADGLSAAHEKGVIHRDLKPENLFVTDDDRLKILDFGIAKVTARRFEGESSRPLLTAAGAILGTVAYMSPEQVRGEEADQRSDLFSFGSILYEMLSGKRAFDGASPIETGVAIVNDEPADLPAGVPAEVDRIVRRCLEKSSTRRFQSARDLAIQLGLATGRATRPGELPHSRPGWRRYAAVAAGALLAVAAATFVGRRPFQREATGALAAERKSIAVLPFINMSSEKENEYFSDGITEELINALSNVEGLRVAARTSAFSFKGKSLDVRQIGAALNVGAVLEGSVRRKGTQLRIVAQLVNVADGYHLWSMTYERELNNIFAVEDEVAHSIVLALRPRLVQAGGAPLVKPATASLAAHDLYLKGLYIGRARTPDALAKAGAYFQQAIEQDATYALAYAGMAQSTAILVEYGSVPPPEVLPKARQAALKALEFDGTLGEAYASLGMIDSYDYQWTAAEQEYRRAIQLKPQYASAHHWYALLLLHTGRLDEAKAEAEVARELDPTSLVINNQVVELYYAAREYARAIETAKKTLDLDSAFPLVHSYLALALLGQKKYPEAVAELEKLRAPPAVFSSRYTGELGYAYAVSGRRDDARRLLDELAERSRTQYIPPSTQALIYMGLGDKDRSFAWLDKAYAERDWRMRQLKALPLWDDLRSDARFTRLLEKVNLD